MSPVRISSDNPLFHIREVFDEYELELYAKLMPNGSTVV
jgi:hypothetical protein